MLANPPYVSSDERGSLAPEITRHEPGVALFAGPDGLDVIRGLIGDAAKLPWPERLAVEVGASQAQSVETAMRSVGFAGAASRTDLAGIDRVVVGRR